MQRCVILSPADVGFTVLISVVTDVALGVWYGVGNGVGDGTDDDVDPNLRGGVGVTSDVAPETFMSPFRKIRRTTKEWKRVRNNARGLAMFAMRESYTPVRYHRILAAMYTSQWHPVIGGRRSWKQQAARAVCWFYNIKIRRREHALHQLNRSLDFGKSDMITSCSVNSRVHTEFFGFWSSLRTQGAPPFCKLV